MIDFQTNDGKMRDIIRLAETVANSKSSVLIQGETGTGKAVMAKYVHEQSGRTGTCVTVNCAQQPEMLLETELFGFEKGAFAGTVSEKRGKFEQATGGTLILDDVTELSAKLQAKLLKVIETGTVERIGSKGNVVPIDVRIIAITNKNIADCVSAGKFLETLYYKLGNATMVIPPLRERAADLKLLVSALMGRVATRSGRRVSGITEEAVQKLGAHNFPGNLRELEGVLERAMMSAQDGVIRATDIAVGANAIAPHQGAGAHSVDWEAQAQWAPGRTLEEIERAVILKSLAFHNGNRTHTARELGISIRTLRNKLNEYRKAGISV